MWNVSVTFLQNGASHFNLIQRFDFNVQIEQLEWETLFLVNTGKYDV